ncbi:MAG: Holliday junction resolvase RuvX [Rhodoblastus sp.]|nr:Holliday junction resolvase RuvX [Rhodoblastus sp.]
MTQPPHDAAPARPKGQRIEANVLDLPAVPARLKRFDRLMGIDLGTKTIGIALSDVERRLASPLETIARRKFTLDAEAMLKLAAKYEVAVFVIGLPLNMDGTEGPRSQATRAFVRALAAKTQIPFVYWDERMSTAAVTRELIAQDVSRAKRAEVVDKMAAAYILQGALDRLRALGGPVD